MQAIGIAFLIYIMAVGWQGNAGESLEEAGEDIGGFIPFIASIIFLMLLNSNKQLSKLVGPFITLAVITTVVTNWNNVSGEVRDTYNLLKGN